MNNNIVHVNEYQCVWVSFDVDENKCHLWIQLSLWLGVHRVCDLAPPHWSLRAVCLIWKIVSLISMDRYEFFFFRVIFCSFTTRRFSPLLLENTRFLLSPPIVFFMLTRNTTHTHTHDLCTFLACLDSSATHTHTCVIDFYPLVLYCMLERWNKKLSRLEEEEAVFGEEESTDGRKSISSVGDQCCIECQHQFSTQTPLYLYITQWSACINTCL